MVLTLVITGCGKDINKSDGKKGDTGGITSLLDKEAKDYELPIVDDPFTLVFATSEDSEAIAAGVSYNQTLPAFEELEKRTGIKVKFEVTPPDQYNTTVQTRLAAGKDLPDLIRLPDDPIRYAKGGLIISIDELIGEYAPNILKLFKDRPEVMKAQTAPDGKIYTLSAVVDARSMVNFAGLGMRKDWLERLDLDEPETIEDWFRVLSEFKDGDPNGNGKNDEIPLLAMNVDGLYKFAWSYGLHLVLSEGWYFDDDGKVIYEWTDPRMKEWLEEMNRWYAAGLLDPDMTAAQSMDKYTAKAIGDIGGASCSDFTMRFPQWNERMVAEYPDARWEGVTPPEGPNGDRILEREQPTENIHYAITRDCKDPETVIKWLDYMFASEEGQILVGNFGIEGLSYNMVDGRPQFTDLILKSELGTGLAQASLGMNGTFPRILMKECIEQRFMQYDNEVAQSNKATEYHVPSFPRVLAAKEEIDAFVGIMADIDTYKDEMIVKFIQGKESLDKFDEYVQGIEAMGIEDAIAIKQAQYDRYIK